MRQDLAQRGGKEEGKEEEEIPKEIKDLIIPNEKVLYVAKQKGSKFKPDFTKRIFPGMIILTDRRILRMQPKGFVRGALGMRDYIDYPYADMRSINLSRGPFRATLEITWKIQLDKGREPRIRDIDKNEAEDICAIIREILAKQETKLTTAPIVVTSQSTQQAESPLQQLEKLGKLKEAGVITEEEFQEKKIELLKKI